MSHIFYKFKSAKDYDAYRFEGAGIPVWELKREIVIAKKLGKSNDFDLILTNAQTSEDYSDDMTLIPKNAQIVVRRVPAAGGKRHLGFQPRAYTNPQALPLRTPITNVNTVGMDEESRIRVMMAASSSHWEQNQQEMPMQQMGPKRLFRPANFKGMMHQVPPDTYVCYRCGQKGHYIQNCPTNADPNFDRTRVRRTTGIPKSFLKPVASNVEGDSSSSFLVTPEGNLVVAAPNEREWDRIATIKSLTETVAAIPVESIPDELKCLLGGHLIDNAVRVPCCGKVFCDECVRKLYEESLLNTTGVASIKCPSCQKSIEYDKVSPDEDGRSRVSQFIESHNKFALPKEEGEVQSDGRNKNSPLVQQPEVSPPLAPHGLRPPPGFPPLPFFLPGFLPPGLVLPPGTIPPLGGLTTPSIVGSGAQKAHLVRKVSDEERQSHRQQDPAEDPKYPSLSCTKPLERRRPRSKSRSRSP